MPKTPARKRPARTPPADRPDAPSAEPTSPFVDGAAARRAATAVMRRSSPLALGDAAPRPGPSLDAEAPRPARAASLSPGGRRAGVDGPLVRLLKGGLLRSGEERGRGLLGRWRPSALRATIRALGLRNRAETVDEFGLDPVYAERFRPLFEALYRRYFRVETVGMEHVPDHGRAMIVANHSGVLPYDATMLMYALRYDHPAHRTARPLVEDFLFHFPFLGVALNRIGCVRACQENAERLLLGNQLAVVFPEGMKGIGKLYRERYQLQRFGRGGFVKLALRTRTPIVPVAVVGAEETHPILARFTWLAKYLGLPYLPITPTFPWLGLAGAAPLPAKWYIHFGPPLDLATTYGPEAAADRVLVNRLTEQVRARIQEMMDRRLGQRSSAFFG